MVTVENEISQQWVKLELPAKSFSSMFNSEWLASGEISVMSFGFFPKVIGVDRLLVEVQSMMVADIFSGFLYIKSQMLKDKGMFEILPTWIMNQMLEMAGLISDLEFDAFIDRRVAFDQNFSVESARNWITGLRSSMKMKSIVETVLQQNSDEELLGPTAKSGKWKADTRKVTDQSLPDAGHHSEQQNSDRELPALAAKSGKRKVDTRKVTDASLPDVDQQEPSKKFSQKK